MMKQPDLQTERPRFTSISLYNHAQGYLSFWYPPEWRLQELDTPHPTITLQPNPIAAATNITIEVKDLQAPLAEDERGLIEEGIKAGLNQLDDIEIESWRVLDPETSPEWGLEWICYFNDQGQRRKRRARVFVSDRYLYSIICQGATEADYAYWQGMFEFVLLTVGVNQFSVADWSEQQDWRHFVG